MIPILAVIGMILLFLLIAAPFLLFAGWITMLCLGALAAIFSAPALAIGFWPSVLVTLIFSWLFQGHSFKSK
jgi:hypothetical protein